MSINQRDYKGEELLLPSSVLGYRQWNWRNNTLIGTRSVEWTNGSLVAECKAGSYEKNHEDHSVPDIDCTCGIYVHYLPLESYESPRTAVFGVVEASGRLLMGTRGMRVEKARIVALAGVGSHNAWFEVRKIAGEETTRRVIDFCTSIGVPYFPTVEQMVLEFPQQDLSSLGVPDLAEWEESVPRERVARQLLQERFEKQAEENRRKDQERMDRYKSLEGDPSKLLARYYGKVDQRFIDTFKHLGGYS